MNKYDTFQSLSGHTSAVEAVRFGNAEEMVVAGSVSGALKIWDLEAAKSNSMPYKIRVYMFKFHFDASSCTNVSES